MLLTALLIPSAARAEDAGKEEVVRFLNQLYASRAQSLLHAEPRPISPFYIAAEKTSRYALHHELRRTEYMHAWAERRNIEFVHAGSEIHITQFKRQADRIKLSLTQSLKLSYVYKNGAREPQHFGVGTRHTLTLKQLDGQWYVLKEWYSDPLEEDPKLIPTWLHAQDHVRIPMPLAYPASASRPVKYDRAKAVRYADKYAGLAWGAGNGHKYNSKYKDYSGRGGDCTNFSSQIVGDPHEGAGLRMTPTWFYSRNEGGSTAWIRTDSFKNYLLYQGHGALIRRGKYVDIMKSSSRFPKGAFAEMKPGDFVGYELKQGDIDHFSIIVGFDANGYPLVNSHSADRYHVPWDLGWDKSTVFWLIHMRDHS
ncbi:hypothetical protein CBW46_012465 [Paenibacillus xerothermodurans]|uniref:Putative amidase domain-containing protein n=2 Tax=Paenibacillus xerothermodurans TaxID=1977292 RepID=A0A2W1NMG8_PAEXE|nr:hypothetical protein CBW46_012465 [Paenibacillus xerothermodurans]